MFHVKHDNPLNKPTTPTTTQNPYGEAHPKKHTPSKYTHRKRITKKQSRIMTDREVEPHSSNSQKELPTILRFHMKHQLLGNNGRKNSSQKPSPTTQPPRPKFHVKQPNRHKLSEDAICCSTEAYSAAGKNHLHQQAKNKKNMSSSLVFLNLQSPITCGGAE